MVDIVSNLVEAVFFWFDFKALVYGLRSLLFPNHGFQSVFHLLLNAVVHKTVIAMQNMTCCDFILAF